MSITDELRECIATAIWQYENDIKTAYIPNDKLLAIADRIDERHRKALEKVAATVDEPAALDKVKGHLNGLDKIAAEYRFNVIALDRRISAIERKLSKKDD